MVVREKNTQLHVQFRSGETFLEFGDVLLRQNGLQNKIPWKKKRDNLIFETKGFRRLMEVLPSMSPIELIDLIYYCVFITEKIEEDGFLNKECIWCQYQQVYFDEKTHKPIFIILPVSGDITFENGMTWNTCFLEMIENIASFVRPEIASQIVELVKDYLYTGKDVEEILEKIDRCGNGKSALLVEHTKRLEEKTLTLHYSGRYGVVDFEINQDEFVLGKKKESVDGVVDMSEAVSRMHCKILKQNQKFFVQDLDSMNHTFVNGEYIPPFELMELEDRDILSVADLDFRVLIRTTENNP